ncbi:MAG: hypothetical protein ABIN89_14965 [Chitinophagaceae bacterium]
MINEKELRTGNLYTTTRNQQIVVVGIDTIHKFVTIGASNNDPDIVTKSDNSIIFEDLHPIEITVTKIFQLGLTKNEPMSIPIISDNTAKFSWDEKLSQVVLLDGYDGIIGQEIKYIHQFQNIYYFLTGKELPLF